MVDSHGSVQDSHGQCWLVVGCFVVCACTPASLQIPANLSLPVLLPVINSRQAHCSIDGSFLLLLLVVVVSTGVFGVFSLTQDSR